MSATQTGVVWTHIASLDEWRTQVGPLIIAIYIGLKRQWRCRLEWRIGDASTWYVNEALPGAESDVELEQAKACALARAGELLAPFVDAYETIMRDLKRPRGWWLSCGQLYCDAHKPVACMPFATAPSDAVCAECSDNAEQSYLNRRKDDCRPEVR